MREKSRLSRYSSRGSEAGGFALLAFLCIGGVAVVIAGENPGTPVWKVFAMTVGVLIGAVLVIAATFAIHWVVSVAYGYYALDFRDDLRRWLDR